MRVSDFHYELAPGHVAQQPVDPRDEARLLVHRIDRDESAHHRVLDLPALLVPGDLLVVNDVRVRPARLLGRRASGGQVELLVVGREGAGGACRGLARPAGRLREGEELLLEEGRVLARAIRRLPGDDGQPGAEWLFTLRAEGGEDVETLLERYGRMPLPPYIRRSPERDPRAESDRRWYQTVFARETGAVAAPTAGLHFTSRLLDRLARRGVELATVTLRVGPGTFRPVQSERVEDHVMHAEEFHLPDSCARAVASARARGGRVIAVGTTSVRVLESQAVDGRAVAPGRGSTSLFVRPGHEFRVVDGLMTNFHLPGSTLLMLVCAFAGRERVLRLYREAAADGYRFHSYGDAMLLLPG